MKTEVLAGITTFMTMAYILAVNPSMLAAAGMDKTAVFDGDLYRFLYWNTGNGNACKLSICTCPGYGIKCLFCIHGMWRNGIRLENRPDGSFCRRSDFYRALPY